MQKFYAGDIVYVSKLGLFGVIPELKELQNDDMDITSNPTYDGKLWAKWGSSLETLSDNFQYTTNFNEIELLKRKYKCKCGSYKRINKKHLSWCMEYTR